MARATLLVSCLLLVLLPLLVRGKPMGGKFTGNRGFTQVLSSSKGNVRRERWGGGEGVFSDGEKGVTGA